MEKASDLYLPELVPADFSSFQNGPLAGKSSLIAVYANWCGYCKRYLQSPVPQQLAELLANSGRQDLFIGKFEGSSIPDHRKIASELFAVDSFPTFLLIHVDPGKGGKMKYDVVPDSVSRESAQAQFQALLDFNKRMKTAS